MVCFQQRAFFQQKDDTCMAERDEKDKQANMFVSHMMVVKTPTILEVFVGESREEQ